MPYERQTHCKNGHELTPENVYLSHRADGRVLRQCKPCRRAEDSAKRAAMTLEERRERRLSYPSLARGKHYQRKYKYGLSEEDVRAMLAHQGGGCGICARPLDLDATDKNSKVAVDHDHETGEVRGLLCQRCNAGIGMLMEDMTTLKRALAYLQMAEYSKGVA